LTRKDLAKILAKELNISQTKADKAIKKLFDSIIEELKCRKKVSISGFGIFYWKERRQKRVLHPRTKEEIIIPKRLRLVFEPSKKLREIDGK